MLIYNSFYYVMSLYNLLLLNFIWLFLAEIVSNDAIIIKLSLLLFFLFAVNARLNLFSRFFIFNVNFFSYLFLFLFLFISVFFHSCLQLFIYSVVFSLFLLNCSLQLRDFVLVALYNVFCVLEFGIEIGACLLDVLNFCIFCSDLIA